MSENYEISEQDVFLIVSWRVQNPSQVALIVEFRVTAGLKECECRRDVASKKRVTKRAWMRKSVTRRAEYLHNHSSRQVDNLSHLQKQIVGVVVYFRGW